MRLHREVRGEGPDLVLLHGWGMNTAVWSTLLPELEGRFRVTLIELPGHGGSEYDHQNNGFDDWVAPCLDAAPERAIWIGWSLGGQIAQRAAVLAPGRVSQLVLVASTPRFVQGSDWPHAMEENTLRGFARSLAGNHRQTLERFLSLQVKGDDDVRRTLRLLRQEIGQRPEPDPRALEQGLEFLLNVDLREGVERLACPVLWLLGERDTLAPADVGESIEALLPGSDVLIIQGAAHAPFLSHPRECLRVMDHFLETAA